MEYITFSLDIGSLQGFKCSIRKYEDGTYDVEVDEIEVSNWLQDVAEEVAETLLEIGGV